jgi:hypothetical protein
VLNAHDVNFLPARPTINNAIFAGIDATKVGRLPERFCAGRQCFLGEKVDHGPDLLLDLRRQCRELFFRRILEDYGISHTLETMLRLYLVPSSGVRLIEIKCSRHVVLKIVFR